MLSASDMPERGVKVYNLGIGGIGRRTAFWEKELEKPTLPDCFRNMHTNYVENARRDDEFLGEYMRLTNALCGDMGGKTDRDAKETLRA